MQSVVLYSGGMDSFTLLHDKLRTCDRKNVLALSVDYGQRHDKELRVAREVTARLGVMHKIIDLRLLASLLPSSSQTNRAVNVPHGAYDAPVMKLTVVPNRNAILVNIAAAVALAHGCMEVATAIHQGDHMIYPDCRDEWCTQMQRAIRLGNWDPRADSSVNALAMTFRLHAPYQYMTKGEILKYGLGFVSAEAYARKWTCYEGDVTPCNKCGACVERAEAFAFADVPDPLLP